LLLARPDQFRRLWSVRLHDARADADWTAKTLSAFDRLWDRPTGEKMSRLVSQLNMLSIRPFHSCSARSLRSVQSNGNLTAPD
jgi:hypothetical protein